MTDAATDLLLIRHAHAEVGPAPGRLCGSFDVPLSAEGRAQLDRLRTRCAALQPPQALYTSPLRRARETADALAEIWQLDAHVADGLGEIDCGLLDGEYIAVIERDYSDLWARNMRQQDEDFSWPQGESYRRFRARVFAGLTHIARAHPAARVAIVTHAGVVAQVMNAIHGLSPAQWSRYRPDLLSVTEIVWDAEAPREVTAFNRRPWR
jgi:broad specificity phosphatase PhoE